MDAEFKHRFSYGCMKTIVWWPKILSNVFIIKHTIAKMHLQVVWQYIIINLYRINSISYLWSRTMVAWVVAEFGSKSISTVGTPSRLTSVVATLEFADYNFIISIGQHYSVLTLAYTYPLSDIKLQFLRRVQCSLTWVVESR